MTTRRFFLAHGKNEKEWARRLHAALAPEAFVDAEDVVPGDDWDLEIHDAQRGAEVTVAIVGHDHRERYFLREELQIAIALCRDPAQAHRLVPVYLYGPPAEIP